MSKAIEKGKVVRVEGDKAEVLFKRSSACGNCHACGMLKDMSEITVTVENTMGAEPGDTVTVEMPNSSIFKGSLAAYVFPLVMLIAGALLGYYVLAAPLGMLPDLAAAIFALAFTAIAFLALKLLEPVFAKKLDKFKLTDKETSDDSASE